MSLFCTVVDQVREKSPFQSKALKFLDEQDDQYWERAEKFISALQNALLRENKEIEHAVDAYLSVCDDIRMETINFIRTGSYSAGSSAEAFENVYSQDQKMAGYIYGLALSQFLWSNHYEMFSFYLQQCDKIKDSVSRYLEIGPGHGLYLAHSIERMPDADITAVDISPASIKITRDVIDSFHGDQIKYSLECKDVHEMADSSYDFIVMGEVLEHVDDPTHILKKLHSVLTDDGYLFVTTCANCPAIDHVYLYDGVAAIREQLESCGFRIVDDLALALSDRPEEEWESRKELLNYAALLTK